MGALQHCYFLSHVRPPHVPGSDMGDTLLCIDEVAEILGVRPRFVRRLVAERRIAFCKIGRYVRFEPEAVEHFIDSGRIDAVSR
jgi:excisionase family DNA binding protein